MKAAILTIGDELLIGQVIDTNSVWMGTQLNEVGVDLVEKLSVADAVDAIHSGLDRVLNRAEIVLLTGGLGPTKDDITKKALASYFETEMVFSEKMWDRIQKLFNQWGRDTTPAHREQCFLPATATILENKMGTAPGMLFQHNGKIIVSMPGVPYEMKYIMNNGVLPLLKSKNNGHAIFHYTIRTAGEGETRLARMFEDLADQLPNHIALSYLPSLGQVRVRLTGRGTDKMMLQNEVKQYGLAIEERIKPYVYGHDNDSLAKILGQTCIEHGVQIGTAESCTGGSIGAAITSVPGSSAYYQGSIISYSNQLKKDLLKVSSDTLDNLGAVSEETVIEMLQGLLELLPIDAGIAVSGIAGPGGGSAEKPVGTIWIAYGDKDRILTHSLRLGKTRDKNIEYTTQTSLNLLRKFLLGME